MSYILDALKKAEQSRHPRVVPTVDTVHAPPPPTPRRRWWPWALGGVGLANAAVLAFFLYPAPTTKPLTAEHARTAQPTDTNPAGSGGRAESAPSADATRTGTPGPAAESHRPAVVTPPVAQPPLSSSRSTALSPAIAPTPRARAAAPPTPTPTPGNATATRTDAVATKPPADDTPASAAPRMSIRAPTAEPKPPEPRAPTLVPPEPGDAARSASAKLKLDVLVYSETPAGRMVFINGRRYAEGDAVEGQGVIEEILPDGVALRHQGQRFTIR